MGVGGGWHDDGRGVVRLFTRRHRELTYPSCMTPSLCRSCVRDFCKIIRLRAQTARIGTRRRRGGMRRRRGRGLYLRGAGETSVVPPCVTARPTRSSVPVSGRWRRTTTSTVRFGRGRRRPDASWSPSVIGMRGVFAPGRATRPPGLSRFTNIRSDEMAEMLKTCQVRPDCLLAVAVVVFPCRWVATGSRSE